MKGALKEHSEKGFKVFGLGFQDSEANIRKYASEHSMPWPVGHDLDDRVAKLYGIPFGAGAVFIDRDGVVRGTFLGPFYDEGLTEELKKIL